MKYWFVTQVKDGPSDWDNVSNNLNQTKITTKMDGYDYPMPVNTKMVSSNYVERFRDEMSKWPDGQMLRQFDRKQSDITLKHNNGNFFLAPAHIPAMFYDESNSCQLDLGLIETALDKHDWVSFGLVLSKGDFDLSALMQNSKYVVRDEQYKLRYLADNSPIPEHDNIRMITFFVAYKLGNTGVYVMMANPNYLSIAGQQDYNNDVRYVHYNTTGNSIVKFAFQPAMNCKPVAGVVIVDKDEFKLEVLRDSQIASIQKTDNCLLNVDFVVKSSWDAETIGNIISCKKEKGMGYLKITFDCDDLSKPYITADDRKITIEYLLLGV